MKGIGIAYPGPKSVAYSSLAFHMLTTYLEEHRIGVKRIFLEDGWLEGDLRGGLPPIIMVSLPYELMYLDLVRMLDLLRIPVYRYKRRSQDPIIIVGGPAVTANPGPILPLVDAVLVGEAEPVLEDLANTLEAGSRERILDELSSIPGMLVPGRSSLPVERIYVKDLDRAWYPLRQETPPGVEPVWGRSFMLETTRGCARGCRFCMEGSIFKPKRDRSLKVLKELLEAGVKASRVGKVSFYSLAFFDSPSGQGILEHAVSMGLETSVPSIRAETLTPERARLIAEGGQRTITIAPETGSCRIAKAIHKPICTGGTMEAIDSAIEGGLRNVKLYIIVGIPGEGDEDLEDTLSMIRVAASKLRGKGMLKVSVNPFIPKPVTAMQWIGLEDLGVLRAKIARVKKEARKAGAQVSSYDPRYALAQTVLSRGDEEVARLIVEWARMGGRLGALKTAVRRTGIDLDRYAGYMDPERVPRWHELVSHPYSSLKMLRREYELYISIMEGRSLRIKA
ncbi:MAG: radical SAM protein [Desulfurococcales archaeon]|nr:radical SAM protein [Desulfurococcales archaeon]